MQDTAARHIGKNMAAGWRFAGCTPLMPWASHGILACARTNMWTCARPGPFTTSSPLRVGKGPLEPSSSAVESCEWVTENSVPYGITLWQPWVQTAFTVRQALSDTKGQMCLTLQGVWRANVRLQNHGGGRAQSTGVTQTRRRDMLCLWETTIASRWPLHYPRYVK